MYMYMQEQRSQGVKDLQSNGVPSTVQGAAQEDSEQDLLCVCQQPYNVDTAMISCDVCEDWYHLRCVGMTQAAAKSMKKYTCPVCLALKGNSDPLQAALAKVPPYLPFRHEHVSAMVMCLVMSAQLMFQAQCEDYIQHEGNFLVSLPVSCRYRGYKGKSNGEVQTPAGSFAEMAPNLLLSRERYFGIVCLMCDHTICIC